MGETMKTILNLLLYALYFLVPYRVATITITTGSGTNTTKMKYPVYREATMRKLLADTSASSYNNGSDTSLYITGMHNSCWVVAHDVEAFSYSLGWF